MPKGLTAAQPVPLRDVVESTRARAQQSGYGRRVPTQSLAFSLPSARLRGIGTVLAIAALCLIVSAGAAWRAIAASGPVAAAPLLTAQSSAVVTAPIDDPLAAPAAGVTGTAALPALPASAIGVPLADGTVHPAQPFSMALATPADRGRALSCLTAAIYYEAANQSDDGERAVAQVVLNRVRHPAFPATVCGVVYQGSDHAGCQFSFACDGSLERVPSRTAWSRATRIASEALAGTVFAPIGLATHYHTYAVTPTWNRSLVMTAAIGAHFFHRWAGWWGTPAAFNQVYRGGEPLPGPLPRANVPTLIAATAPIAVGKTSMIAPAALPAAQAAPATTSVQPAYADSGAPVVAVASSGDDQILDRWKDSGKPLR